MLEVKLETLQSFGTPQDGSVNFMGVNQTKIENLAKDGWRLVTTISPRPSPEVIIGVFYRKAVEEAKKIDPAPPKVEPKRKPGRPKKSDA